ncbi:MAG TPA: hypothetical protein VGK67_05265 [Myxococcales bacterium]
MRTFLAALVVLSFPAVVVATESHHGAPAHAAPGAPAAEAAPGAPAAPSAMAAPAAPAAGANVSDAAAGGAGGGAPGASGGAASGGAKTAKAAKSTRSSSSSSSASVPAAAKVGPEECDLCKARSAYLKAGKTQTTGLSNGVVIVSTGNVGALDKAATEFDNQLKAAIAGKSKLDDGCVKFASGVSGGKVTVGHGKTPTGHVITTMTTDENLALELYEMMEKVVVPKKGAKK